MTCNFNLMYKVYRKLHR